MEFKETNNYDKITLHFSLYYFFHKPKPKPDQAQTPKFCQVKYFSLQYNESRIFVGTAA